MGRPIALAPDLAQAHLALGTVLELRTLDFTRASEEYERALALAPLIRPPLWKAGSIKA
jgi:hypothetical protein